MASLSDYETIIYDWVDVEGPYDELPLVCFGLHPEPYRCESLDDLAKCFVDYLYASNFEEALDEHDSAITRLDAHFAVFYEDYLMPAGD